MVDILPFSVKDVWSVDFEHENVAFAPSNLRNTMQTNGTVLCVASVWQFAARLGFVAICIVRLSVGPKGPLGFAPSLCGTFYRTIVL